MMREMEKLKVWREAYEQQCENDAKEKAEQVRKFRPSEDVEKSDDDLPLLLRGCVALAPHINNILN